MEKIPDGGFKEFIFMQIHLVEGITMIDRIKGLLIKPKRWNTNLNAAGLEEKDILILEKHIEKYVGKIKNVFQEMISDNVHIDICIIEPTKERPYFTLITTGMSAKGVSVPNGVAFRNIELLIHLPSNWDVSEKGFKDEKNYWPIRWLKTIAQYPHACNTWLGIGHTIPNGEPPEPLGPNTQFTCWMTAFPALLPQDFFILKMGKDKSIYFLNLIPIFSSEMDYKLKNGSEQLFDKMDEQKVFPIINIKRQPVV